MQQKLANEIRKEEIIAGLLVLDEKSNRPMKSIKVAELQNTTPDKKDTDKLIEFENNAKLLREELDILNKETT